MEDGLGHNDLLIWSYCKKQITLLSSVSVSELLIVACNVITCLHTWVPLCKLANKCQSTILDRISTVLALFSDTPAVLM